MVSTKIKSVLQELTSSTDINLSFSDRLEHGDYTTNIALKSDPKNSRKYAEELVLKLKSEKSLKDIISKIEIAGPGFINFFISESYLSNELQEIVTKGPKYGRSSDQKGKRVIVEYSSPNIAKPFTIGHLRSTIIGDAVANLLEVTGATVYRDNHLGDWGTQFGKQIYAIKTWGNEESIEKSENPVKELVALYVKFHEEAEKNPELEDKARAWFKKLEDGDHEARRLWQKCVDWSLKEFQRIYKLLGITFTENKGTGYGESFFEDKMTSVVEELKDKNLLKEGEEGARLVFFDEEKYPPLMITKKDGATLYATRDLASDKFRLKEYGSDVTIINEVGAEQSLYFQQLFEIEKMLGWVKEGQRVHLKHGFFRFADKKMSTRKGNVVWLEDVLNEAVKRAMELSTDNEVVSKIIAVGALKWNELKRDPVSDIVFDWDEILNMKGNSGPYMQYTVVRINSLVTKSNRTDEPMKPLDDAETEVVRYLSKFPQVLDNSSREYRPSQVSEYLYTLAQKYNSLYDTAKIIGGEREKERITISKAVGIVLTSGLHLLGISVPEKM